MLVSTRGGQTTGVLDRWDEEASTERAMGHISGRSEVKLLQELTVLNTTLCTYKLAMSLASKSREKSNVVT